MSDPSRHSPTTSSRLRPNGLNRQNPWEPSTTHANGHPHHDTLNHPHSSSTSSEEEDEKDEIKDSTRNPALIFLYTILLTIILTLTTLLTLNLFLTQSSPTWRLPFFLCALSLFHLLEYAVTATYNPHFATTSAFLLNNGRAYNMAHCLAFVECGLHLRFRSSFWFGGDGDVMAWAGAGTALGFVLMLVGQAVRTAAMVTAGSNFNHIVQSEKRKGHVLVTGGVYAWLRHPSYFGFFWWGLGTQLVLGNVVCLVGYAVVLWRFFRRRIESELPPATPLAVPVTLW